MTKGGLGVLVRRVRKQLSVAAVRTQAELVCKSQGRRIVRRVQIQLD